MRVAKTRNTTRLTCCACSAKCTWTCPKFCACQEKCTSFLKTTPQCVCHAKRLSAFFCTRHHESRATQNDRTTSVETLKNERFRGFSHRHSDATRKPENRDETCRSLKVSMSRKTSSNVPTSCPTEPQNLAATSNSMFRARHPSIFITCHKMPRLPRNLHVVIT